MLLKKALSTLRVRLDDVAAPYLWTDTDLIDFLNDAEKEACERAKLIEDDSYSVVAEVTSLTRSGGLATAVSVAHGLVDGQRAIVEGADQAGYNLNLPVSVLDADTFTYPVDPTTVTPATGTITATSAAGKILNFAGAANVSTYRLDPCIIQIRSAVWGDHFLFPIARETLNDPRPEHFETNALIRSTWAGFRAYFGGVRDWSKETGTPRYFIDPQESYLQLFRIPTTAEPIHLSVYRRPLAPLSLDAYDVDDDGNLVPDMSGLILVGDTQSFEIHPDHHLRLIDWAEHLAYGRRDSDAGNQKLADAAEAKFTASFGIRPDANQRRQQRARRRNTVVMNPSW